MSQDIASAVRERLCGLYRGRKLILVGAGPVEGLVPLASQLDELGAESFLLTSIRGARVPGRWPHHALDIQATGVVDEFRLFEAALRDLPEEARRALDAFDPEGEARFVSLISLSPVEEVAGRRPYGGRILSAFDLEDKVQVDPWFRGAGVTTAPAEVAAVGALGEAHERLDRGHGTVIAGDAREGLHGGAERVHWAHSEEALPSVERALAPYCDRARVMPFLEGVPCSIHGVVFRTRVLTLRPVEMIVLRAPGSTGFRYSGFGTFFDPEPRDREAMRDIAWRMGTHLRARLRFLGPFTIDGVLSEEGFRPTELNPRFGAALGLMAASAPELLLGPLALAATEGEELDDLVDDLEKVLLDAIDSHRSGRGSSKISHPIEELTRHPLVEENGAFRAAGEGETPDGHLLLGPASFGGFLRYLPDPDRVPAGEPLAPRVARAFAWADRHLDTRIGPLQAPTRVR
ncbi:MAG: hypothetical protein CL910_06450 [Deltaproteobacteria bacterium]|jgi:hypothetical protein|nr:hypothetical protein [Deltaproteobacteria bacterium]